MVSRQETARPLLTPGEVMQLPGDDELVLVSGVAPIRARKLRYYLDANFRTRLAPPPVLDAETFADRPPARVDDWSGRSAGVDARLDREAGEDDGAEDEGGVQQQRHPGLEAQACEPADDRPADLLGLGDEDGDAAAEARAMDRARAGILVRARAMNEGGAPQDELLPSF